MGDHATMFTLENYMDVTNKASEMCVLICWRVPASLGFDELIVQELITMTAGMGISVIKIRRSSDRLISIMEIPLLVRGHRHIETGPCFFTFGPRGRRARSDRRPRAQNVEESPWTGVSSGPSLQFSKCDFALSTNPAYVIRWLN